MRLFRYMAGECDARRKTYVIVVEQEYQSSRINMQMLYKKEGQNIWKEDMQKNYQYVLSFPLFKVDVNRVKQS